MRLFTDRARDDPRPLRAPETSFAFYDRVAGPYWDDLRRVLEDWFAHLPAASRPDLRSRFQGKDRRQVDGAFWELYLHELFRRLGCAVQHQPRVPRAGAPPLTPDFLAERDGERLYLEAVAVTDSTVDDRAARRRMDLVDAINARVASPGFALAFEIERMGSATPRVSEIARSLQGWLDGFDPDRVAAVQRRWGISDWPAWEWVGGGWRLRAVAMPKPPEARGGPDDRVIGLGPSWGKVADAFADARAIRDKLREKAEKYDGLDAPYVLALLVRRGFCTEDDVAGALFGGGTLDATLIQGGRIDPSGAGDRDGLWATRAGPDRRHVSGVLCAINLIPEQVAERAPTLWHNPWATRPITTPFPCAAQRVVGEAGALRCEPATRPPAELFGLPTPWPPGPPFPRTTSP